MKKKSVIFLVDRRDLQVTFTCAGDFFLCFFIAEKTTNKNEEKVNFKSFLAENSDCELWLHNSTAKQ
ncbi:hypothetical protein [Aliifodinibius sp. S!AR15-10]|uniref:hypothetical protein n=1 Tax=Aliifodinibius sp. S!AR15-10 TaxID=2950437 RepID=UPI00286FDD4B|nr:hypothetical protein [Aliifodinibius sp. S!AR15-10]